MTSADIRPLKTLTARFCLPKRNARIVSAEDFSFRGPAAERLRACELALCETWRERFVLVAGGAKSGKSIAASRLFAIGASGFATEVGIGQPYRKPLWISARVFVRLQLDRNRTDEDRWLLERVRKSAFLGFDDANGVNESVFSIIEELIDERFSELRSTILVVKNPIPEFLDHYWTSESEWSTIDCSDKGA